VGCLQASNHLERPRCHPHNQSLVYEAKVIDCHQQRTSFREVPLTDDLKIGQETKKDTVHCPQHTADEAPT
jgi:hypothetical protein